ncbi:hypothetical protein ACJX0J_020417, partial [Zea mays]
SFFFEIKTVGFNSDKRKMDSVFVYILIEGLEVKALLYYYWLVSSTGTKTFKLVLKKGMQALRIKRTLLFKRACTKTMNHKENGTIDRELGIGKNTCQKRAGQPFSSPNPT